MRRAGLGAGRATTLQEILDAVCAEAGVSRDALLGPRRAYGEARRLACYLMAEICLDKSLPTIGRFLELDRVTVVYHRKRARRMLCDDPEFRDLFERVARRLEIRP
ncbi:MAG: helix-turn-helix domain-containing protein [Kiloniellaceae bacterium]